MRFLVIGAAGQVGQEFAKCMAPEDVTGLTHEDVEITDPSSVDACLKRVNCDVVVNLAAFHNVDECETDLPKAFVVNAIGAGLVARAAREKDCKVVYFSSDYVFGDNDRRRSPYFESDAVGPVNAYGVSKVAGEQLVRASTGNHLIVRSSSLFGVVTSKKGWTFPEMILERARTGEPLRVVNDQYMSPTYTADLVGAVIALVREGLTGTVHITNGGGCTWHEFATATLKAALIDYPIEAVSSDAFPSVARRPAYSRLDSERLDTSRVGQLRSWEDALRAYLIEKGVISRSS
ncbi:MAG: dTDP-4-dehydrorhamnose reductase [Phycisphaerales bacterium]|nr:MAG: dTDP-4-dehydrorhamnose reductase [Phycisphaerales bacterium]